MKHNARITPGKSVDDGRNKASCLEWIAPNTHFPGRRVGEKLDVFHRLAQLIEHRGTAIEQGATVPGWLDALRVAVEQTHAKRVFQIRNRFRNVGLRGVQVTCRLSHAAGLHDSPEDVQVLQLDPASDAIAHLHGSLPYAATYALIETYYYRFMTAPAILPIRGSRNDPVGEAAPPATLEDRRATS